MSIEFRCNECQRTLRAETGSIGATARCPSCGATRTVPPSSELSGSPNPFKENITPGAAAAKPDRDQTVNPYDSPKPVKPAPVNKPAVDGEVRPTAADAGDVISYAFEVWKENLGMAIAVTAPLVIIGIIFGVVQQVVMNSFLENGDPDTGQMVVQLIGIPNNLIQIYLGVGMTKIYLKMLRGEQAYFGEIFGSGVLFLKVLVALIISWIALTAGLVACIIPGILLMLFFWPFYYLIIDEKAGIFESFGIAGSMGKENLLTTFVLWIASIGIMLLGLLACGIGLFVAAPLVSLIYAAGYLMMSGQLSADPRRQA